MAFYLYLTSPTCWALCYEWLALWHLQTEQRWILGNDTCLNLPLVINYGWSFMNTVWSMVKEWWRQL